MITLHKNRYTQRVLLLLVMLPVTAICSAICDADSVWEKSSLAQKMPSFQSHLSSISEQCLSNALASIDMSEDESTIKNFISILEQWAKTNTIGHQILFAGYKNEPIHRNRSIWQAVLTLWEKSNPSPYAAVVSLINSGAPSNADTLLRILDSEGKIDIPELLRWAKIKVVIHDYTLIPALYCRIISKKPQNQRDSISLLRAQSVALDQFSSQIDEIRGETADQLLQQFKKCSLEMLDADSSLIRSWLAQVYSRLGLFDRELETLTSIVPSNNAATLSADLADIARERYLYQHYIPALRAAKASYSRARDGEILADAAAIIYQSFLALGLQDSALVWIKKANLTTESRIIDAIVLYQNSAQTLQAQALIDKLGPSLTKDTLQIRAYIMNNQIDRALSDVNRSAFLKRSAPDMLLWKIRILIFTNKISDVAAILDSNSIPIGNESATELLRYKYWLERLQDCRDALEVWSTIEYNNFKGKLEKNGFLSQNERIDQKCQWRLALMVARIFYEKKKLSASIEVLNSCNESHVSADFLYFKALYLYESGKFDSAKVLLQRIVLDHTDEIYSGKARLQLTKMELDQ